MGLPHTHSPSCPAKITATLLIAKSNPHALSNQHSFGKSFAFRKDYMTNEVSRSLPRLVND